MKLILVCLLGFFALIQADEVLPSSRFTDDFFKSINLEDVSIPKVRVNEWASIYGGQIQCHLASTYDPDCFTKETLYTWNYEKSGNEYEIYHFLFDKNGTAELLNYRLGQTLLSVNMRAVGEATKWDRDYKSPSKIPRILHYCWYTSEANPFEVPINLRKDAIKSIRKFKKNKWTIYFWVNNKTLIPETIKEFEKEGVQVREHWELNWHPGAKKFYDWVAENGFYARTSDITRSQFLYEYGGIFTDLDVEWKAVPEHIVKTYDIWGVSHSSLVEVYLYAGVARNQIYFDTLEVYGHIFDLLQVPYFKANGISWINSYLFCWSACFLNGVLNQKGINPLLIDIYSQGEIQQKFFQNYLFMHMHKRSWTKNKFGQTRHSFSPNPNEAEQRGFSYHLQLTSRKGVLPDDQILSMTKQDERIFLSLNTEIEFYEYRRKMNDIMSKKENATNAEVGNGSQNSNL